MYDVYQLFGDFFPFVILIFIFIFLILIAFIWALFSIISMSGTLKDILKVLERDRHINFYLKEKKDGTNSVSSQSRSDRSE